MKTTESTSSKFGKEFCQCIGVRIAISYNALPKETDSD